MLQVVVGCNVRATCNQKCVYKWSKWDTRGDIFYIKKLYFLCTTVNTKCAFAWHTICSLLNLNAKWEDWVFEQILMVGIFVYLLTKLGFCTTCCLCNMANDMIAIYVEYIYVVLYVNCKCYQLGSIVRILLSNHWIILYKVKCKLCF